MDREVIIPEEMREIVARAGYAPAVKVGDTIYVVGQVGRTRDLQVIEDPREQFRAIWENLRIVLEAADCTADQSRGRATRDRCSSSQCARPPPS